jgi:hypothetical protein
MLSINFFTSIMFGAIVLCFLSLNPLSGNAPYFSILLCLTPYNFTSQVESAAMHPLNPF